MSRHTVASLVVLSLLLGGCGTIRALLGYPDKGDPSVAIRSVETRWLLVKNPRFGDIPSEPEYVWVEEDKRPWTFMWGIPRRAPIAPPEVAARYGAPPGGGRVSPRQGLAYQVPTDGSKPIAASAAPGAVKTAAVTPAPEAAKRGFVVWADTTRIVVDLTAKDGLHPGSVVSLRRDKIPIVHPVTGELLGELDEEVGTARVTETRDKFSVAEIQTVAPGAQVQLRDRVVPK
jgi:hypothetical protein